MQGGCVVRTHEGHGRSFWMSFSLSEEVDGGSVGGESSKGNQNHSNKFMNNWGGGKHKNTGA